jgi:uncharacterized protein
MTERSPITVIKNDHTGREVWRYEGVTVQRRLQHVVLEAIFNRDDMDLGYTVFRRGDRFVEWFYADRWYNVFEIHDRDDDHIKGWYCNFTRPAHLTDGRVEADDLALDLWVGQDHTKQILDRDEFDSLPIPDSDRRQVELALQTLLSVHDWETRP